MSFPPLRPFLSFLVAQDMNLAFIVLVGVYED